MFKKMKPLQFILKTILQKLYKYTKFSFLLSVLLFSTIEINSKNLSHLQKSKLREVADELSKHHIRYAGNFKPSGTNFTLKMDCSNTARYMYEEALDVHLPRTSYDQYISVKNSGNLKIPPITNGKIDSERLKKILKTGDLLFWINTHSDIPKNWNPPIGHVMVYMGKSKKGEMIMAGAGTYGKGKRTKKGGVDFYKFDPNARIGCVRDSQKNCLSPSEFFGFGKPTID
jgi:hypothetical protein